MNRIAAGLDVPLEESGEHYIDFAYGENGRLIEKSKTKKISKKSCCVSFTQQDFLLLSLKEMNFYNTSPYLEK